MTFSRLLRSTTQLQTCTALHITFRSYTHGSISFKSLTVLCSMDSLISHKIRTAPYDSSKSAVKYLLRHILRQHTSNSTCCTCNQHFLVLQVNDLTFQKSVEYIQENDSKNDINQNHQFSCFLLMRSDPLLRCKCLHPIRFHTFDSFITVPCLGFWYFTSYKSYLSLPKVTNILLRIRTHGVLLSLHLTCFILYTLYYTMQFNQPLFLNELY